MRDGARTIEDLCSATGRTYESIHNSMKRLVTAGRVRMHYEQTERTEAKFYTLCAREDQLL